MPLRKLTIYGKVQGVAYRYSTKQQADRLGVKGIVRNQADGTVYAEIEGTATQLEAMLAWCRQGPPLAEVNRIEVVNGPERQYQTFTIIR